MANYTIYSEWINEYEFSQSFGKSLMHSETRHMAIRSVSWKNCWALSMLN